MEKTAGALFLAYIAFVIAGVAGWINNIVVTVQHHATIYELAIGLAGVFAAPLGAVRGFCHFFGATW